MFNFRKARLFLVTMSLTLILSFTTSLAATYTVVKGDSLYTIGKMFNTTSNAIKSSNGLSSSSIYPGQKLNIQSDIYTVKSGDTLYLIAKKYGISLYYLKKANNEWDNYIYPGQKLALPGVNGAAKSTISYSASDLDLLARLITAEAQSESYKAQVGVGAVVVNRVLDSRFPNTISGVIYEKSSGFYQFTPVENGWINKPATETSKRAAYDALHGSDPSYDAVYYFDDSTTSKWMWSKPIAVRIGKMVFAY